MWKKNEEGKWELCQRLTGHRGPVLDLKIDSNYLYSVSRDGPLKVYFFFLSSTFNNNQIKQSFVGEVDLNFS